MRRLGPNPKEMLISDDELLKIRQVWRFEEGDWEEHSYPASIVRSRDKT